MLARWAAAIVGAWGLTLLAPPLNLHGLHWVAYLPMFWALRADSPRANLRLGYAYGFVAVASLFWWIVPTITTFSPGFWTPAALLVLVLFSAVFGLPYVVLWSAVHPLRRRLGAWWVVALPALQVLLEWFGTYALLFPYHHGVSQYRFPYTWQLVSVTGIWGLSYLVFLVNAALAEVMYRRREGRGVPVVPLAGAVGALSAVIVWGAWRYERVEAQLRDAERVTVAQLQSSQGMLERMRRSPTDEFELWMSQTRGVPDGTDLAVWPEGASPYDLAVTKGSRGKPSRSLSRLAAAKELELIVGGGSHVREQLPDGGREYVLYNSVFHISDDGELEGKYDKMVPLPFGEYLPFGDWAPDLRRSLGIGDFHAGDVPVVFAADGATIASPICYEAILSRVCRQFPGADLFVTVTNDAWFGDTAAPHQHAMLAAVRAVELGVPMFRDAYTGVSMVIEPHGAIHYETDPFTDVHRVVEVRVAAIDTVYRRWGDWFVLLCAATLGFLALRRISQAPAPRAPLGANGPTRGRV